jgi:hypothetical protein
MPCRFRMFSDGLSGDRVAEIGESAGDAIVPPAFVLLCHADDECFDFRPDARPARVGATIGAIELADNQPSIPGEDRFRFGNTGNLRPTAPTEPPADLSECGTLGIGKAELSSEVRPRDPVLRDRIRIGGAGAGSPGQSRTPVGAPRTSGGTGEYSGPTGSLADAVASTFVEV